MSNTVKTEDGIEVYENNIKYFAEEYISDLPEGEDSIYNNPSLFTGMIKYIYKHLFKNNPVNNDDIGLIDNIWGIYADLCYRYNKRPTLLNFSLLVGINNDTFNAWKNGEYRRGENGASSPHSRTVKKWLSECESSLLDGATERNSVGCIFALKANYGYTETPQQIVITGAQAPALSQDEIRQIAEQASQASTAELLDSLPDD